MGLISSSDPAVLIVWNGIYTTVLGVIILSCLFSLHYKSGYIYAEQRAKSVSIRNAVVNTACAIANGGLQYYTTVYPSNNQYITTYFIVANLLLAITTSSGSIQVLNRAQFIIAIVSIVPILSSVALAYYISENAQLPLGSSRNTRHIIVGSIYLGLTAFYVTIRWIHGYLVGWGEIWFGNTIQAWCDHTASEGTSSNAHDHTVSENHTASEGTSSNAHDHTVSEKTISKARIVQIRKTSCKRVIRIWIQNAGIRNSGTCGYTAISIAVFLWAAGPTIYFSIFLHELHEWLANSAIIWSIVISVMVFIVQYILIITAPNNLTGYTPAWKNIISAIQDNGTCPFEALNENELRIAIDMYIDMLKHQGVETDVIKKDLLGTIRHQGVETDVIKNDLLGTTYGTSKICSKTRGSEMIVAVALILEANGGKLYSRDRLRNTINLFENNRLTMIQLLTSLFFSSAVQRNRTRKKNDENYSA